MVTVDPFTRRVLRRRQPETAVTLAQPPQDRHGKQHHPGLANDLSGEKLKATTSKAEKHDAVDNQPDTAAGDGCKYQPTPLERCVDGHVDELRKQKSDSSGDDPRRARKSVVEGQSVKGRVHVGGRVIIKE